MTAQQASQLGLNLTYIYSIPPGAGVLPIALPLGLLGASGIFLVVGAQVSIRRTIDPSTHCRPIDPL